ARRVADTNWYQVSAENPSTLAGADGVEDIVLNDVFRLEEATDASEQWAHQKINLEAAWSAVKGSEGKPIVAVLDTGLDVTHPSLRASLWTNPEEIPGNGLDDDGNGYVDDIHGADTVLQKGAINDSGEHGTHVAGIIAADGEEVKGVSPDARLMGVKIFDQNGYTDVASVIRGIRYATQHGAVVVNCSWGGAPFNQALFEAMRDSDTLFVCSAGNRGHDVDKEPHYPSGFDLPNVVAVAASNRSDGLSFISNYGARTVDVAAPGVQILSTVPGAGVEVKTGTSMAAPHVSGAAALLAQKYPDLEPVELKSRLLGSVDETAELAGKVASGGRLNAGRALEEAGIGRHGPNLLGDFYRDFQESLDQLRAVDNTEHDSDPREGFVTVNKSRFILTQDGLAMSESGFHSTNYVWMRAGKNGETLKMEQDGFEMFEDRYYRYPLLVEGGADTPYDPPDAEVSTLQEFREAERRFSSEFGSPPG
ncbi:MAG: S8 family serine peptidase, partial [Candidatus Eremiobacteraeota bacterium]|nr:S8 family serine peptidase [Candidatus Eremiobacteraeota bacterium]